MPEKPWVDLGQFVDLERIMHKDFLSRNVFDLLGKPLEKFLESFLHKHGVRDEPVIKGEVSSQAHIEGLVLIDEGASVEPGAFIKGPCYVGPGSEVRHGAYIRGNVYIGRECVVGHVTEVKGSVFLDGAKAGHFAYVGDSLLGREVNLGAGTKLANLKIKAGTVFYQDPSSYSLVDSGLRKFGSVLGDGVQTGCNSVLSPGSFLFPNTHILPCAHFRGTLKPQV